MALSVIQANPTQTISVGAPVATPNITVGSGAGSLQQNNYNPQPTAVSPRGPVANPQVTANPQQGAVSPYATPAPAAVDVSNNYINGLYGLVGARQKAGQTAIEYYDKTTGQAFGDPTQLASFLNSKYGLNANSANVFDMLKGNTSASTGYSGGAGTPYTAGAYYGGTQETSPALGLNPNVPSNTTPSSSLTSDTGYGDIMKLLSSNLSNMDSLFANLQTLGTIPQTELDQQAKVANDQAAMTALGYQAQGLYNPDKQTIALPFLTGQAQGKMVGAGIQSQLDQSVLNYMQGNRQFAFNSAKDIFDASRNNISTMLDIYSKAAPQNVSTNYNPSTGQLTAIMRNPLTGATYTSDLGNIGAQKSFTSTQVATDPLTGALTFVGTTSDGRVVQEPIGGMSGSGIGVGTNGAPSGVGTVAVPGYSGATQANGTPWRTDRNNNPIAAAVSTGSTNQFTKALDQAGIKWTYGDAFPGNPGMSTIKILGNPVEGARAILANSNAIQGWYASHTGKAILSKYGITNNEQFANAPVATQNAIIDGIYRAEAGSGVLTNAPASQNVANLPAALQQAVKTLPDGTKYFDTNNLTSAQIPMAQTYGQQYGIKYVAPADASKLNNISVTQQNLSQFKTFVDSTLNNLPAGGLINGVLSNIGSLLGGTDKTKFTSFRTTALNSIQALAGGEGSGFRLNQSEINSAIDNLPTIYDTKEQANVKLQALNNQMNNWINQIIPGAGAGSGGSNTQTASNSGLQYQDLLKSIFG